MPDSNPSAAQYALSPQDDAVSRSFVEARLNATPLSDYPGDLPDTLERAYAIQSASMERWPDQVGGWKVARLPMPDRDRFATERLVGPVFSPTIREVQADSTLTMPIYKGGFAAVEAEIVMVLGSVVPPSTRSYSKEELADIVADVYCGAEIASSPLAAVNDLGATSIISDFGCNAGVVVGPPIADWRSVAEGSVTASVRIDDTVAGTKVLSAITGDPLKALRALISICADRGVELAAGSLVSTGMITGVHKVEMNSKVHVEFEPYGGFDLAFEATAPR